MFSGNAIAKLRHDNFERGGALNVERAFNREYENIG